MKTKRNFAVLLLVTLIMILAMTISVNAASISKKTATIKKGATITLKMSGAKSVKWSSNKKSVATVSGKGVVKGVAAGSATITATVNKKKYTCKVTVTAPATKTSTKSTKKTTVSTKATTALDGNTTGMSAQEAAVYKKIMAMKSRYPEGMRWTNANFYEWKGGIFRGGYGCAGFAFAMSDAAFGDAPAKRHTNFGSLHTGDIIRYMNNTHMVIVMKVLGDRVVVAEGNYNCSIHWGRVISMNEIKKSGTYVITRY